MFCCFVGIYTVADDMWWSSHVDVCDIETLLLRSLSGPLMAQLEHVECSQSTCSRWHWIPLCRRERIKHLLFNVGHCGKFTNLESEFTEGAWPSQNLRLMMTIECRFARYNLQLLIVIQVCIYHYRTQYIFSVVPCGSLVNILHSVPEITPEIDVVTALGLPPGCMLGRTLVYSTRL